MAQKVMFHLQLCAKTTHRTGGKDYCPLTEAHVQVVHKKNTATPYAEYAKIHSERDFSLCNLLCMLKSYCLTRKLINSS